MYENCDCFKFHEVTQDILIGEKLMLFGQFASSAMLFAKFHVCTIKSLSGFWQPLLEQLIKSVFVVPGYSIKMSQTSCRIKLKSEINS